MIVTTAMVRTTAATIGGISSATLVKICEKVKNGKIMHSNFQVVVHSFFKFGILATICRLKLHMYGAFVQKKLHWGQFQKEKREQVSQIHFLWSASSHVVGRKKNPDSFLAARVFARLNGET